VEVRRSRASQAMGRPRRERARCLSRGSGGAAAKRRRRRTRDPDDGTAAPRGRRVDKETRRARTSGRPVCARSRRSTRRPGHGDDMLGVVPASRPHWTGIGRASARAPRACPTRRRDQADESGRPRPERGESKRCQNTRQAERSESRDGEGRRWTASKDKGERRWKGGRDRGDEAEERAETGEVEKASSVRSRGMQVAARRHEGSASGGSREEDSSG